MVERITPARQASHFALYKRRHAQLPQDSTMRPVTLILLGSLLFGCSSQPANEQPATVPPATQRQLSTAATESAPAGQQLHGTLLTPAAGSIVELALLLVDSKGRPRRLLESRTLTGTGQALPFTLPVVSTSPLSADLHLQLRARVTISGQLVQRLPGTYILSDQLHSNLGMLKLVAAP